MTAGRVGFFERPVASPILQDAILYLDAANSSSYPGTGTVWTDLSGNNNTGTLVGPTFNAGNDGYFTFDGTNDYVYTANQYNFNSSITVSAWFRTNVDSGKKIVGLENSRTGNSTNWDRHLYVGTNGYLYWGAYQTQPPVTVVSTNTVTDNVWRYALGTFRDVENELELYINGVSQNIVSFSSVLPYQYYIRIGALRGGWVNMNTGYFPGDIAFVAVYNRAFSTADVLQNFNATRGRFGV